MSSAVGVRVCAIESVAANTATARTPTRTIVRRIIASLKVNLWQVASCINKVYRTRPRIKRDMRSTEHRWRGPGAFRRDLFLQGIDLPPGSFITGQTMGSVRPVENAPATQ